MTALLLPGILSTLLLAAHYVRSGHTAGALLLLMLLPLLALGRPWTRRMLQLVLLLGAAEWLRTLWLLARLRVALGEPWTRMALILGAVAAFTALSAALLEARRVREYFTRDLNG